MKDRQEYFAVIQDLAQTIQAATIYPENHQRIQQLFARLHKRIGQMTSSIGTLHIGIIGDHFVVDEFPFLEMNPALRKLLGDIREKGIEKFSIRTGLTYGELSPSITGASSPSRRNPSQSPRRRPCSRDRISCSGRPRS